METANKKFRYSIRKFKVGVGSVLIATCLLGAGVSTPTTFAMTDPSPATEDTEVKKTPLQHLKELVEELKTDLEKLKEYPEYDSTKYPVQKMLWDDNLSFGEREMGRVSSLKEEDSAVSEIPQRLFDFRNHIIWERLTRQVDQYRKKYPDNKEIEEEYKQHLEQTDSKNYASQEASNLQASVNEAEQAFEKIKEIAKEIESKRTLVQKLKELIQKIEMDLEELEKFPKYDVSDYPMQSSLWSQLLGIGKSDMEHALTLKDDSPKILEFSDKLADFKNYITWERLTREVNQYRKKHPNNEEIEEEYKRHLEQTEDSTYATQEGSVLKISTNNAVQVLEKIKEIVKKLESKEEPAPAPTPEAPAPKAEEEVPTPAPVPETPMDQPKMEEPKSEMPVPAPKEDEVPAPMPDTPAPKAEDEVPAPMPEAPAPKEDEVPVPTPEAPAPKADDEVPAPTPIPETPKAEEEASKAEEEAPKTEEKTPETKEETPAPTPKEDEVPTPAPAPDTPAPKEEGIPAPMPEAPAPKEEDTPAPKVEEETQEPKTEEKAPETKEETPTPAPDAAPAPKAEEEIPTPMPEAPAPKEEDTPAPKVEEETQEPKIEEKAPETKEETPTPAPEAEAPKAEEEIPAPMPEAPAPKEEDTPAPKVEEETQEPKTEEKTPETKEETPVPTPDAAPAPTPKEEGIPAPMPEAPAPKAEDEVPAPTPMPETPMDKPKTDKVESDKQMPEAKQPEMEQPKAEDMPKEEMPKAEQPKAEDSAPKTAVPEVAPKTAEKPKLDFATKERKVEEALPIKEEIRYDASLALGKSYLLQEGKAGKKVSVYQDVIVDGKVVATNLLSETVVEGQNRILVKGSLEMKKEEVKTTPSVQSNPTMSQKGAPSANKATLPATGEQRNNLTLVGLGLAGISLAVVATAINKKSKDQI
ncbi:GAG-binding domain-containing protein [Streptococcus suis]|uniref:GAG-binding domain-containing protein n=3 Tax=Streptococcus suis TaxID=1307 RepID=UPI0004628421|nr:GAG-binding domain-containing protein [Streptococcus suis]